MNADEDSDDDAATVTESHSKTSISSMSKPVGSGLDLPDYENLWNEFTYENNSEYQVIPLDLAVFPVDDLYAYEDEDGLFGAQYNNQISGFDVSHPDNLGQSDSSTIHNQQLHSVKRKRSDSSTSTTTELTRAEEVVSNSYSSASLDDLVSESAAGEAAALSTEKGRPIRSSRIQKRTASGRPVANAGPSESITCSISGSKDSKTASTTAASQRSLKRKVASGGVAAEASKFPVQLVEKLNAGDANEINALVERFLMPECRLCTQAFPHILQGHVVAKSFFNGMLQKHPDMVMCLTDVHLNPDNSVIFRGTFEGTFLGSYDDNTDDDPADKLSAAKNNLSFVDLIMDGRNGDKDFHLSSSEIARLEKLEQAARKQNVHVKSFSKWICKIVRTCDLSIGNGSEKGKTRGKMEISELSFDWKTCDIRAAEG